MDDGIRGATVQDITWRGPFRVTQNPRREEPARLRVGNLPLIRPAPAAAHPHAAGRRVEAGRRVSGGAATAVWPAAPPPETTHLGGLRQQGRAAGTTVRPALSRVERQ